jgi:hypothetical protein
MSTLFDEVLNLLTKGDREELRQHQREWLKERLDCDDDFICTKAAYIQRIHRLNSVSFRIREKANARDSGEQCRVADPEPPLNVRTTPNGSVVGALSNDTRVVVLDYNPNKTWAFVGRYEDRSPVGWVFTEYLDCKDGSHTSRQATTYSCSLVRQFPKREKEEKDPVIGTTVIVAHDNIKHNVLDIEIQYKLRSGIIHKRHEQYRDYKTSITRGEDSTSWRWSGVLAINHSLLMKGEFIESVEGAEISSASYTEQLTANGRLDWAGVWSCSNTNEDE